MKQAQKTVDKEEKDVLSFFPGWHIITCNLLCMFETHYHCPYCAIVLTSVSQFGTHLQKCAAEFKQKATAQTDSGENGGCSESQTDNVAVLSDADRKQHLEHVKSLTGENYVCGSIPLPVGESVRLPGRAVEAKWSISRRPPLSPFVALDLPPPHYSLFADTSGQMTKPPTSLRVSSPAVLH